MASIRNDDDGRVVRGRGTRERLIAVARAQFGAHGYDATSVENILSTAGVARGALYHHFSNKGALFDAVLEQVTAELGVVVHAAAREHTDPLASLRAGCIAWLRRAAEPAVQQIVLLDAPAVVGWSRWRSVDEQDTVAGTKAALRRLADAGRLPAGSADVLAHLVVAAVGEAALLVARAPDPAAALVEVERAIGLLLDRLLTPG